MTKTCPDCQATVLSTSQPERMATQEYFLRAMANNYAGGHCWDHLDSETCVMAADEIAALRAALAATPAVSGRELTPQEQRLVEKSLRAMRRACG